MPKWKIMFTDVTVDLQMVMTNLCVSVGSGMSTSWVKHFWLCLWGCSHRNNQHLNPQTESRPALNNVTVPIQSTEAVSRLKRQRKGGLALLAWAGTPIFSWFSGLWSRTGTYTIWPSDSQAFGHRLMYTTSFPGSPAYTGRTVGLLSPQNRASIPTVNFFFTYIPTNCVSLENVG